MHVGQLHAEAAVASVQQGSQYLLELVEGLGTALLLGLEGLRIALHLGPEGRFGVF